MCALIFIAYAFFSKSEVKNRLGDDFNEGTSWLVANYYDLESNKNAKPRERYQTSLDSSPQKNKIREILGEKKIILFGLPVAFASTCSKFHLPGFLANASKIKEKCSKVRLFRGWATETIF